MRPDWRTNRKRGSSIIIVAVAVGVGTGMRVGMGAGARGRSTEIVARESRKASYHLAGHRRNWHNALVSTPKSCSWLPEIVPSTRSKVCDRMRASVAVLAFFGILLSDAPVSFSAIVRPVQHDDESAAP